MSVTKLTKQDKAQGLINLQRLTMSSPLNILEEQAKKNERTDEPKTITSDSAGWISCKISGNAYQKERRIERPQSRLNIGSLSIKFFKKRPGPIRRAFIKWLLGWTWDELTQKKEEDQECTYLLGPSEQGVLSARISHLPIQSSAVKNSTSKRGTGYYYQGNSGSVTFGDRNRDRDIDRDIALNA